MHKFAAEKGVFCILAHKHVTTFLPHHYIQEEQTNVLANKYTSKLMTH